MNGRVIGGALIGAAFIAGAAMYYLQVYAFYDRVEVAEIPLTATDGTVTPVPVAAFEGIDSDSSPIRFRACFDVSSDAAAEDLAPYPQAEPLIAPRWFDCFDAAQIAADLQSGAARAVLAQTEIRDGVDRVVAIYPDGRAYAWHQLNEKYRD